MGMDLEGTLANPARWLTSSQRTWNAGAVLSTHQASAPLAGQRAQGPGRRVCSIPWPILATDPPGRRTVTIPATLWRDCYPHFIGEETEAQRGQILCPRPHSPYESRGSRCRIPLHSTRTVWQDAEGSGSSGRHPSERSLEPVATVVIINGDIAPISEVRKWRAREAT